MRTRPLKRLGAIAFAAMGLLTLPQRLQALHPWVAPTPAELSMTSVPGAPGAPAVILDYEEYDDDVKNHSYSYYVRIKVLTEAGKDYGDVALGYASDLMDSNPLSYTYFSYNYTDIAGRTIEPDGTIVEFTGKPYTKMLLRMREGKVQAKVFTMPDVRVGSILEYRYSFRYDNFIVSPPDWMVQRELYMLHGKFIFNATTEPLNIKRGNVQETLVAWTWTLPKNVAMKRSDSIDDFQNGSHGSVYTLEIRDVPPKPDEKYMPPQSKMTYQVHFYYTNYTTIEKFWEGEGKYYSGEWDKFIGGGGPLKSDNTQPLKNAVDHLTSTGDSDEAKLRKIYGLVQSMDNTAYSRNKTEQEDKAAGIEKVADVSDVLTLKSGPPDELTMLFVGLARAAGLKAYVMDVSSRNRWIFDKNLLRWSQMDHFVAIVDLNGKEQFFDPGVKFCKFGQLAWQHTDSGGVRQTDGGTAFAMTPFQTYAQSSRKYAAVLTLDDHGVASGQVQEMLDGSPALKWRQDSITRDLTDLKKELTDDLAEQMPGGMELSISTIANLTDPEKPLVVNFSAKGAIGTASGHRLLIPGDLFQVNEKPLLTEEKRQTMVDLDYAVEAVDAVKVTLPAGMQVELLPDKQSTRFLNSSAYDYSAGALAGNAFLVKRVYLLGNYLFPVAQYDDARGYYSKTTQMDQGVVLVKTAANGQ